MSNCTLTTPHGEYKPATISPYPCWTNKHRTVEHSPLTTRYINMTWDEQAEFLQAYKEATNE